MGEKVDEVSVPSDPPLTGHTVQFYDEDAFLLEDLRCRIAAALGGGSGALVIATATHRAGLAARLTESGLDLAHAARQGRYVAVDAAETLARITHEGQVDATAFADVVGNLIIQTGTATDGRRRPIIAFGEMVALVWERGYPDAALHLEQLWNELVVTHGFTLHCAYPLRLFAQATDDGSVQAAGATHSLILPTAHLATLTAEARLSVATYLQHKARALETELAAHQRTQEALRQRNDELRTAIAARDVFLSAAAHELKNPITSVQGMTQLLMLTIQRRGTVALDRLTGGLSMIDAEIGRLHRLLLRLLDAAQIEKGKFRIEPTLTDFGALVHQTLMRHPGHTTHTMVYTGSAHLEARIDPVRLEQVVVNLLDNAVKFSAAGGTVLVAVGDDGARGIQLSVTDHGVGIPSDQHRHVFERFYQVDTASHRPGMGLGLYIIREIVELHGGTVRIEEPGHQGTRFVVTLPPLLKDTDSHLGEVA